MFFKQQLRRLIIVSICDFYKVLSSLPQFKQLLRKISKILKNINIICESEINNKYLGAYKKLVWFNYWQDKFINNYQFFCTNFMSEKYAAQMEMYLINQRCNEVTNYIISNFHHRNHFIAENSCIAVAPSIITQQPNGFEIV